VWVRLVGAPGWVCWLVTALLLAPILAVPVPDVAHSAGWASGLVILGIYSLVFAAALQRPVQRSYPAAVDGLGRPQRSAAIRVRTLSMACQRRAPRWHRTSRWWVPLLSGLPAAVGFSQPAGQHAQHLRRGAHRRRFRRERGGALYRRHRGGAARHRPPRRPSDIRHGVVWAWLALIMARLAVWSRYRGRRFGQHLERLRAAAKSALAAAKSALAAAAASGDAADPIALPPRRVWRPARVAIIAGLAIVALVMVSNWPTPTPERRTADGFISRVAAHRKMLQASLSTAANPSLSRYDVKKWLPSIDKAMHDANITTPDQQAAFLAQIAEESGCLWMITELPWGLPHSQWNDVQAVRDYFNNKYANINGNGDVSSGDGYNYRGRGILQITGKSNYAAVSEKLYGDDRLVQYPDLLSQPDTGGAAAAAYWNENNLNRFIPPGQPVTPQQFQDLGSTINTGHPGDVPNNAAERVKYWEVAKAALGVT
jgi:putative chitinase